jgi:magnesium chelatase family protein
LLARVLSGAVQGIDAYEVQVEVDIGGTSGQGAETVVGLPDTSVKESMDRVRAAVRNSGFLYPTSCRLTINLAPADTRKEGTAFDLPISLGILAANGQMSPERLARFAVCGELGLDGAVRPVNGVLPLAMGAKEQGRTGLVVPSENAAEAAVVPGLAIFPVGSLREAFEVFDEPEEPEPFRLDGAAADEESQAYDVDFSEIKGHYVARRALEVAAAGGHNLLMVGPPGSGKTRLYSVCGGLRSGQGLLRTRPFRSPHHTVSYAGLVGGGAVPRPGEISLSHHGVLFLDELPEFRREVLEVLRQPLEDGYITISRAQAQLTFPARFMLVASMNPCPCGYHGDSVRQCLCTPQQISKYFRRISGPIYDRIDIHCEVPRLTEDELVALPNAEPSSVLRERVQRARQIQKERFEGSKTVFCNAHMKPRHLRAFCGLDVEATNFLRSIVAGLGLSARAFDRILKVARTIADLEGAEQVQQPHLAEAAKYRELERKLWH